MKKLLSLLLAAVMCLSLVACGGGNDTPSTNDDGGNNATHESENSTTVDYANEFAELLCDGKWVMREGDDSLSFSKDGTFIWNSNGENTECTWSFVKYFDSFSEFPLAMGNSDFSDDYSAFWGYGRDNNDIVIGYNNDGELIMHHKDAYWTKEE